MARLDFNFNPSDWASVKKTYEACEAKGVLGGINSDCETMVFTTAHIGGENALQVKTFQDNGWIMTQLYYIESGVVEESYNR